MKGYITLFSVPAAVGILSILFSKGYLDLFSQTDPIIAELGSLLSPEAKIILPTENATLFSASVGRFIQVFEPDITAVVKVGAEADVPVIINYAKEKGRTILPVNARHGWATSLRSVHNAIMIDINTLTTINIDTSVNTMTLGGGAITGDVVAALQAAGKETSTGVCNCVGFLGAALGGGHGRLQGLHGLIADNLVSARVALASGELITVSSESHPDLFWGLRGAGHNFGIVTEAVYKVYDQTNGGFQFNADITYASDQVETLFTAITEFNKIKHPAETSIAVLFLPQPPNKSLILLSYVSSAPNATAISQLNSAFGHIPHLTRAESVMPWEKVNSDAAFGLGKAACVSPDRKNAFGASLLHYDIPTIRTLYDQHGEFVNSNPGASGSILVFETYATQAVRAVDKAETAYPHRDERHIVLLIAGYTDASLDATAAAWFEKATDLLHSTSGFEKPAVYLNYAQGTEGFGALYGYEEWRQEKLKGLKRKYDPDGMFNGYHPIPRD